MKEIFMEFGIYGAFEYRGHTWKSTFLQTDQLMTEEDRFRIRRQIADMYFDKKRST